MFKVKIVVTNRKNIIELSKIINSPCAIISISGSNEPMPDIIKNPFIRPKIIPPILFNPFKTGTLKILFTKPSSIFTKAFINTNTKGVLLQ